MPFVEYWKIHPCLTLKEDLVIQVSPTDYVAPIRTSSELAVVLKLEGAEGPEKLVAEGTILSDFPPSKKIDKPKHLALLLAAWPR